MKRKKTISVRHPQLERFRNALREVIFRVKLVELREIRKDGTDLEPTESNADLKQMKVLSDKRSKLERAWNKSLCVCSLCGSRTSNMTFNPFMEEWFCVDCYEKNQGFYKAKARKGQIWNSENYVRTPSTKWWP
jgi:hypothetical protein